MVVWLLECGCCGFLLWCCWCGVFVVKLLLWLCFCCKVVAVVFLL